MEGGKPSKMAGLFHFFFKIILGSPWKAKVFPSIDEEKVVIGPDTSHRV
jgi:hypothetical protein